MMKEKMTRRYCAKCGVQIAGNSKFCRACGEPTNYTESEVPQSVKMPKPDKKGMIRIIVCAAIVLVIAGVIFLIPRIKEQIELAKLPAYERPLRIQADAINDDDFDRFWKTYSGTIEKVYKRDYWDKMSQGFKDIEFVVYKVEKVEKDDSDSLYEFLDAIECSRSEIEDAKTIWIDVTMRFADDYEDDELAGKTETVNDWTYTVVKINGKWYAMSDLTMMPELIELYPEMINEEIY